MNAKFSQQRFWLCQGSKQALLATRMCSGSKVREFKSKPTHRLWIGIMLNFNASPFLWQAVPKPFLNQYLLHLYHYASFEILKFSKILSTRLFTKYRKICQISTINSKNMQISKVPCSDASLAPLNGLLRAF